MTKNLTDNQIKFCEEYLVHGNGSRAYKTAYPHVKKDSSARTNASKLLTKANIQAYLDKRKAEIAAKLEITPERTLRSYARRAYFDPRQLADENGNLIPLHRLNRNVAAAVTEIRIRQLKTKTQKITIKEDGNQEDGIETVKNSVISVKWDNGDSSREAISKFLGLFKEDNEQNKPHIKIYNQVRAEIEKELVEETFQKITKQQKERDPNVPGLV